MNTELKAILTPEDNKACRSLPVPIHSKIAPILELALMHKYEFISVLPFSKYRSCNFGQRKPDGELRLVVDVSKINTFIEDISLLKLIQLVVCQMQHNTRLKISLLRAQFLPSLSPFADDGTTISGKSCFHFG